MEREPPTADAIRTRLPWAGIVWAGAALAVVELLRGFVRDDPLPLSHVTPTAFAAGVLVALTVALVVHLGPVWVVGAALPDRWRPRALVAAALVFGWGWHLTMVQGDGLRASDWYLPVRIALAVLVPCAVAAFAWLVLIPGRMSERRRRVVLWLAIAGALAVNLFVVGSYRDFHGYLAVWIAVLVAFAGSPVWARRSMVWGAFAVLLLASVAASTVLAQRRPIEGNVRRLTCAAGPMLAAMPLTEPLLLETERLVDPRSPVDPAHAAAFEAEQRRRMEEAERLGRRARGRNVLLVVLESTRWDAWVDEEITPSFHRWRAEGVYVPRAVAQYPATPLAYGSMFTAQPPSVVAQSPHWSGHPLFQRIASRFDHRLYTRPDIKWFDHTAITSFFVPEGDRVHEHRDTEEALAYLTDRIDAVPDGESFFAWAHLYDPHAPWEHRPGYELGGGELGAYRSEVAYLDARLGELMEWLYERPDARETLVMVIGDHGEGLGEVLYGEPFFQHHVHVASVLSWVPFYASGPGLPAGEVTPALPVSQLDVMPTLYDFVGEPLPAELSTQGRSLYATIGDPEPRALPTEAFSIRGTEFFDFVADAGTLYDDPAELRRAFRRINEEGTYAPKLGLQVGTWKIVYDAMLRRHWLYDLEADPYERHDLSEERPEELARMRAELSRWRRKQAWTVRRLEGLL